MKLKTKSVVLIILALAFVLSGVAYAAGTHHILAHPGDHYYMLCADGQFNIVVNGADSVRVDCVGGGNVTRENHGR